MKKKLFGYLTLAFAIMGAGLVGSCNDYCEDLYDEYRLTAEREDSTLSKLIQQNIADIKELQTKFKTCQDSCKARWSRLSDSIKVLQDSATNGHNRIYTELASLQATDKMLGEAIDSVKNVLDTLGNCIGEGGDPKTALVYLFTTATEAKADAAAAMGKADRDSIAIENIKYMWSDSLSEVYSMAAAANALATRDSIFMYDLKEYIDSVDSTLLDSISAVAVIAKENLQKAKDYAHQQDSIMKEELLDSMDAKLADVYKAFQKADSLLQDSIDSLAVRVKKNTERIEVLEDTISSIIERLNTLSDSIKVLDERVDSLMDAEKKRITSLLVQGTINPAFGSFSLPVGIKSNILMTYYGEYDAAIKFPTTQTGHMVDASTAFTARDAELLGTLDATSLPAGTIISDSANNAGKLYLTVNPIGAPLDSTYTFTLVNSVGDTCAATLGDFTPSTEKLTFGYTRATADGVSDNGFYEAPVQITADAVESLKPNIDVDAIKGVAKSILESGSSIDLSGISQTLMNSFSGVLDANAVKVTWTDSLGEHSVMSGFDLAVAAVKPLSYHTFAGIDLSSKLPSLDPIAPQSFSFDDIEPIVVSFGLPSLTVSSKNIDMTGVNPTINVGGTDYPIDNLTSLINAINEAVGENVDSIGMKLNQFIADVNAQVNGAGGVIDQINGTLVADVNAMLDNTATEINTKINGYINKLNSYLSKVNSAVSKLPLKPAQYLQPTLLYQANDGSLHQLAASKLGAPQITGSGSLVLYPTSYTAEILAPAYQKFVAVTDVIDPATGNSAQLGDATCESVLASANGAEDLNKAFEGNKFTVSFAPTNGYIYEIAYSAIDYQGWIATRKFYVYVK